MGSNCRIFVFLIHHLQESDKKRSKITEIKLINCDEMQGKQNQDMNNKHEWIPNIFVASSFSSTNPPQKSFKAFFFFPKSNDRIHLRSILVFFHSTKSWQTRLCRCSCKHIQWHLESLHTNCPIGNGSNRSGSQVLLLRLFHCSGSLRNTSPSSSNKRIEHCSGWYSHDGILYLVVENG